MARDEVQIVLRVSGPNINRDELLVGRQGLRVGRTADNDLALEHREISRRHMRIIWQGGGFWVEDLESSNGVWVNDLRVRPNTPQALSQGDVIRCGPFLFTFLRLLHPEDDEAPEALPGVPVDPVGALLERAQEAIKEAVEDVVLPALEVPPPADPAERPPSVPQMYATPSISPAPPASLTPPSPPNGTLAHPASSNGYPYGIPRDRSSWLQYLPAIYSQDDFVGRYLLIFESIMSPLIWMIDNFDLYLSPEVAPPEWLRWMAGWFDVLLVPQLPAERQRAIVEQMGWLFLRRGTRVGLERLLELYFGVRPEIIENADEACHFIVRLPLSKSSIGLGRDVADRLIMSQKPAFASYALEIT
jgi:phage tail-like protein